MQTTIATRRLTLRPLKETDAGRIAYLAGDYDVAKMCGRVPHPYPMSAAYSFIGLMGSLHAKGGEHAFAVTTRIDGMIGCVGVTRIGEPATWELGYWYGMPYWGLGYASEAGRALMDWARDQLGAKVFGAGHFADNPASGKVLRKLGFARTGETELFGLARQGMAPAERYVWPEGAASVSLSSQHHPH